MGLSMFTNLWLEYKKSVWTSKIYFFFFFEMFKVKSFLSVAPNIRNELFIKPDCLIFHAINDFAFNSLYYYILQGNLLKHSKLFSRVMCLTKFHWKHLNLKILRNCCMRLSSFFKPSCIYIFRYSFIKIKFTRQIDWLSVHLTCIKSILLMSKVDMQIWLM